MGLKKIDPDEEFVMEDGPLDSQCRVSQRARTGNGYAKITVAGNKTIGAHVHEWQKVHGEIPKGSDLHHLCENRPCCNLEHLELLTRKEHGRRHSPLTQEAVDEIRSTSGYGTGIALAAKFGVSPITISRVRGGALWA